MLTNPSANRLANPRMRIIEEDKDAPAKDIEYPNYIISLSKEENDYRYLYSIFYRITSNSGYNSKRSDQPIQSSVDHVLQVFSVLACLYYCYYVEDIKSITIYFLSMGKTPSIPLSRVLWRDMAFGFADILEREYWICLMMGGGGISYYYYYYH